MRDTVYFTLPSGLFLSGAAASLNMKKIPEDIEDGILTAKELSKLDLSNLNLAILSACQTGLGEIVGDGVFGLQRGFKKAGAQTLLMSLWKVDDTATQLLMAEFYKNLVSGQNKRAAFLNAQIGDKGTLVLTFTDFAGIVTTATIAFE